MSLELLRLPAERRAAEDFARLVDGTRPGAGDRAGSADLDHLAALATTLRDAAPAAEPSRDFSAALRARLVQETAERPAAPRLPSPRATTEVPARPHRVRQAVATAAAAALLGGAGAAVASTAALPGDSLYGLKRGLESVQLSIAGSDMARGREHLEQADSRLAEAEGLVTDAAGDAQVRARLLGVLEEMDAEVRTGSDLLTGVYADTGDVAALELLDQFVVEQQQRLDDLTAQLAAFDPALAEAAQETARLLADLHETVLALTATSAQAAVPTSVAGATRDPRASGDGWAVSRISAEAARSGTGLPAPAPDPADGADQAASAPGGSQGGLLDAVTRGTAGTPGSGGTGSSGGSGSGTELDVPEVIPTVAPSGGGTAVTPPVPALPSPPVDLPVDSMLDEAPCVPVAPLTDC